VDHNLSHQRLNVLRNYFDDPAKQFSVSKFLDTPTKPFFPCAIKRTTLQIWISIRHR